MIGILLKHLGLNAKRYKLVLFLFLLVLTLHAAYWIKSAHSEGHMSDAIFLRKAFLYFELSLIILLTYSAVERCRKHEKDNNYCVSRLFVPAYCAMLLSNIVAGLIYWSIIRNAIVMPELDAAFGFIPLIVLQWLGHRALAYCEARPAYWSGIRTPGSYLLGPDGPRHGDKYHSGEPNNTLASITMTLVLGYMVFLLMYWVEFPGETGASSLFGAMLLYILFNFLAD